MSIDELKNTLAARIADTAAAAALRREADAALRDVEDGLGWDCAAPIPPAVASARDRLTSAWAAENEAEQAEQAARAAVWEAEEAGAPPKTEEEKMRDWLLFMVAQARQEEARLRRPRRLRGARILPHGV